MGARRENYRLATRRGHGAALEKAKRNEPHRGRRGRGNVLLGAAPRHLGERVIALALGPTSGRDCSEKAPTMIDDCLLLVPLPVRAFCRCSLENGGRGCMRRSRLRRNRRLNRNVTLKRDESGGGDDDGGGDPPPSRWRNTAEAVP
jgi:hypothetical protein